MNVDAIRARHVRSVGGGWGPAAPPALRGTIHYVCAYCHQTWGEDGCDTAIVLAALEEAGVEFADTMRQYEGYRLEGQAAIERERRLRAALDIVSGYVLTASWPTGTPMEAHRQEAIAALDAALATTPEGE